MNESPIRDLGAGLELVDGVLVRGRLESIRISVARRGEEAGENEVRLSIVVNERDAGDLRHWLIGGSVAVVKPSAIGLEDDKG